MQALYTTLRCHFLSLVQIQYERCPGWFKQYYTKIGHVAQRLGDIVITQLLKIKPPEYATKSLEYCGFIFAKPGPGPDPLGYVLSRFYEWHKPLSPAYPIRHWDIYIIWAHTAKNKRANISLRGGGLALQSPLYVLLLQSVASPTHSCPSENTDDRRSCLRSVR